MNVEGLSRGFSLRGITLSRSQWAAFLVISAVWLLVVKGNGYLIEPFVEWVGRRIHADDIAAFPNMKGALGTLYLLGGTEPADIFFRNLIRACQIAAGGIVGLGGACIIFRTEIDRVLTDAPRFRWLWAIAGTLIVIVAAELALDRDPGGGLNPNHLPMGSFVVFVLGLLVCQAMTGYFEEAVFRGCVLRVFLGLFRSRFWAAALNSLLFAAVHFPQNLPSFGIRAGIGFGLCWTTFRLNGVELAAGLHAGIDIVWSATQGEGLIVHYPGEPKPPIEHVPLAKSIGMSVALMVVAAVVVIGLTELALLGRFLTGRLAPSARVAS